MNFLLKQFITLRYNLISLVKLTHSKTDSFYLELTSKNYHTKYEIIVSRYNLF